MQNILCGIFPYLMEQKLTCKGYAYLLKNGIKMRLFASDALELKKDGKTSLIGMTKRLREKLISNTK